MGDNNSFQSGENNVEDFGPTSISGILEAEYAIVAENLSKMFPLFNNPESRLKHLAAKNLPRLKKLFSPPETKEFWAVRDISFSLKKGEVLGVMGKNGAGKSTLLQILAGISAPSGGSFQINGRVSSILELGSGFHPDFSGRENVIFSGAVMGLSKRRILGHMEEIKKFAEIGEFFDRPVRTYSSGMFLRLAFAVHACLSPDILLVDEVVSVGDIFFQQKCHERMERLIQGGSSVVMVSHDILTLEKYCTSILVMDSGRQVFLGDPIKAVEHYFRVAFNQEAKRNVAVPTRQMVSNSDSGAWKTPIADWPTSYAESPNENGADLENGAKCIGLSVTDPSGESRKVFQIGESVCIYCEFEILRDMEVPVAGLRVTNARNLHVHSKGSFNYHSDAPSVTPCGSRVRFRQRVELSVAPGLYTLSLYVANYSAHSYQYMKTEAEPLNVMGITSFGPLEVIPRLTPPALPFYDLADLAGDLELQVIMPEKISSD